MTDARLGAERTAETCRNTMICLLTNNGLNHNPRP